LFCFSKRVAKKFSHFRFDFSAEDNFLRLRTDLGYHPDAESARKRLMNSKPILAPIFRKDPPEVGKVREPFNLAKKTRKQKRSQPPTFLGFVLEKNLHEKKLFVVVVVVVDVVVVELRRLRL